MAVFFGNELLWFELISNLDCTGQRHCSRALERLIQGLGLNDMWETSQSRTIYTHYTTAWVSRLDRIYITDNLRRRKQVAETLAPALTDHLALIQRLTIDTPRTLRRRGFWRMNISFMDEPSLQNTMKELWEKWQKHIKYYPNRVLWWDRYVKRVIL